MPTSSPTRFRLRFPESAIAHWATRYKEPSDSDVEHVGPSASARGWLTRAEFLTLCHWKSPRPRTRYEQNSDDDIKEITRIALSTTNERLKVGVLLALDGVSWPTASVILHLCDTHPYPILDFRALWSLGVSTPPAYSFAFWKAYVDFSRTLATRAGASMRHLDRALWQYSKERQRRAD